MIMLNRENTSCAAYLALHHKASGKQEILKGIHLIQRYKRLAATALTGFFIVG